MGDSRGSGQMQRHRRQSQDINANKHAASLPLCSLCSTVPLKSIKGWTFPFLTVYTLDIPIGRGLIDRSDTMFAYQIPYMGIHNRGYHPLWAWNPSGGGLGAISGV